jgi:hypothetical protein
MALQTTGLVSFVLGLTPVLPLAAAGAPEALRPEAERLVERLFQEKKDSAEVVATLRADGAVSEPLRRAALRLVMRRGNE